MEYLYTPRYCYISPLCFTAQRRLQVHDPLQEFRKLLLIDLPLRYRCTHLL